MQAREAYSKVRAAQPNDLDANRALGLVLYQGQWISEEDSYKAQGYVKYGSDWMTTAERDATTVRSGSAVCSRRATSASSSSGSDIAR